MKKLRLKEIREGKKLKQDEVAEMMNVNATTYSSWENNKTSPKVSQLSKFCELLGVDITTAFEGSETTTDKNLIAKIKETSSLPEDDKKCLTTIIEGLMMRHYAKIVHDNLNS
jgi:transcriptional regulator with XRE-family HTH domain